MRIAHLADIHIQDRRRDEYAAVFTLLYAALRERAPELIVVAGDVFDNKMKASPHNIEDVSNFLAALAEIAPVVLIAGNHDTNCLTPHALDLLTPVVAEHRRLQPPKLTYFRSSGVYVAHGIVWTVVAPDGEKPPYAATLKVASEAKLLDAPRICLFHEEVNGAMLPSGIALRDFKLGAGDFAGHDLALGGHIHLRQLITPRAGYCGSLIQQNIGEPHGGHGFVVWELTTSARHAPEYRTEVPTMTPVDLENPLGGYLRVVLDADGHDVTPAGAPRAPRYWEFAYGRGAAPAAVEAALARYGALHGKPRAVRVRQESRARVAAADAEEKAGRAALAPEGARLAAAQESAKSFEVHEAIIERLLTGVGAGAKGAAAKKAKPIGRKVIDAVKKMHREYYGSAMAGHAEYCRARVRLLRLEFSDLYCYGGATGAAGTGANVVDFTRLEGCVSGIIAPNFSGKTSLIDVILYALYDKHPRCPLKGDMIRGAAARATVTLEFELDGKRGRIMKRLARVRGSGMDADGTACEFRYDGEDRTRGGVLATVAEIRKVVGSYEAAVPTAFSLQGFENSGFVATTPRYRKQLLADILALGAFAPIDAKITKKLTEANTAEKTIAAQFRGETAAQLTEAHAAALGDADDAKIDGQRCAAVLTAAIQAQAAAQTAVSDAARAADLLEGQLAALAPEGGRDAAVAIAASADELNDDAAIIAAIAYGGAELERLAGKLGLTPYDATLVDLIAEQNRAAIAAMPDYQDLLARGAELADTPPPGDRSALELAVNSMEKKLRAVELAVVAADPAGEWAALGEAAFPLAELRTAAVGAAATPPAGDTDAMRAAAHAARALQTVAGQLTLTEGCPGCAANRRLCANGAAQELEAKLAVHLEAHTAHRRARAAKAYLELRAVRLGHKRARAALRDWRAVFATNLAIRHGVLAEISNIRSRMSTLARDRSHDGQIAALRVRLDDALGVLDTAEQAAARATAAVAAARAEVDSVQSRALRAAPEIGRLEARLAAEEAREAAHTEATFNADVLRAYKLVIKPSGGIADELLQRSRGDLTAAINRALGEIGSAFEVNIDEKFGLQQRPLGRKPEARWITAGLASGYQKFELSIATRVALWKLAEVPLPDCLVIDEGFSAGEDKYIENMGEVLTNMSSAPDAPRLIFVVSHVAELKARIEQALTISINAQGVSSVSNVDAAAIARHKQELAIAMRKRPPAKPVKVVPTGAVAAKKAAVASVAVTANKTTVVAKIAAAAPVAVKKATPVAAAPVVAVAAKKAVPAAAVAAIAAPTIAKTIAVAAATPAQPRIMTPSLRAAATAIAEAMGEVIDD
jgi:UDP-2,3-diacylglucosamine pyrophosphatase LpxH